MRKLKVYGWQGVRKYHGPGAPCTREIVAAPSMAAIMRITGDNRRSSLWNCCETGNEDEITEAMSAPGQIFWRPIDDRGGPWRRGERG